MRHITAHISIWNKLGWIGIICYFCLLYTSDAADD